jgi:hypothetical protein
MTPNNKSNRWRLPSFIVTEILLVAVYLSSGLAVAQEEELPAPQPITEEIATELEITELEMRRERVLEQRRQITALEERIGTTEERFQPILETRLDLAWIRLLEERVAFAEYAADQQKAGYDLAVSGR